MIDAGSLCTLAVVPWLRTWSEIRADFEVNWIIYLSMPIVAALVGYTTKLVAIEMLYRPLEYRGIGPFGWQGIVPRRAAKVAAVTIELLTSNVLRPEELLEKIDPQEAVAELEEPLRETIDDLARDLTEALRPGLWAQLPEAGRRAIINRGKAAAPRILENLLAKMRSDLPRYLDLQYMSVTLLVKNKEKLNGLMRGMAGSATSFIRRSGIYFGLVIGTVQMVAWGYFHNPWIMPAFGFFVGFTSDWLALNMLFHPRRPRRFLGIPIFGVLHKNRAEITEGYAKIMAEDLLSPDILFDAILNGPSADQVFLAVEEEISAAIDTEAGIAGNAVRFAVGTGRYEAMKKQVVDALIAKVPDTIDLAKDFAARTIDIENTISEKMSQLSNDEFEAIMRPVFKDDELLMISVGAVLGFLVGEGQVLMVHLFEQTPH